MESAAEAEMKTTSGTPLTVRAMLMQSSYTWRRVCVFVCVWFHLKGRSWLCLSATSSPDPLRLVFVFRQLWLIHLCSSAVSLSRCSTVSKRSNLPWLLFFFKFTNCSIYNRLIIWQQFRLLQLNVITLLYCCLCRVMVSFNILHQLNMN